MGSRTWIKIYCDRWLNGSIRDETPELRGIWVDLLVLAGSGKYGDSGEIKITDQAGFLDKQLADLLQISVQKWVACKKKLIQTDRVCVKNRNIIAIINWSKYQSEYNRQRVYRQPQDTSDNTPESSNKKLQPEVTTKSTTRERDKRIEKEIREEEGSSSLSKEDVVEAYERTIGPLSEDMENEIELAVIRFTAQWVIDAIREGVKRNKKTWVYVAGILKNWERFGKDVEYDRQKPYREAKRKKRREYTPEECAEIDAENERMIARHNAAKAEKEQSTGSR